MNNRTTQIQPIKNSPFRSSYVDLYIFNFNGSQTAFGFDSIPVEYTALKNKIASQINNPSGEFGYNFINYATGKMLCVNTPVLLNKDTFKTVNAVSKGLKFSIVRMPEDFINMSPSKLSSPYRYGEKIRASASYESILTLQTVNGVSSPVVSKNKTLVFRDTNIKGRFRFGESTGGSGGIGIWS